MKKRLGKWLLLAVMFSAVSSVGAGLSYAVEKKPVEIKKSDKCQVCGMFVSAYPRWVAQILFKDGSYAAFDGPKDMFKYYLNVGKYNPSKKQADILAIYVTEYYSAKSAEAQGLFYVQGSDVNGPMGAELVPVMTMEKAKEFMKDHGGRKILKFEEVQAGDLR
jgi:nitrous oxide reductase accessory protein NosL